MTFDHMTEHLLHVEREAAAKVSTSILETSDWIQFWSPKSVNLDGDFNVAELKQIVAMMEAMMGVSQR